MTDHKLVSLLRRYDKHLFGLNASYKQAAELLGYSVPEIKKCLASTALDYWKNPDYATGPRMPTKEIALTYKEWDSVKQFFARHAVGIVSEGVTVPFIVRVMRSKRLPANESIVNEMLSYRKITLKGVC